MSRGKRPLDYAVDVVAVLSSTDCDLVEEIYGSGHERYCDYKPYIREDGFIWCLTCDIMIPGHIRHVKSIHVPVSKNVREEDVDDDDE